MGRLGVLEDPVIQVVLEDVIDAGHRHDVPIGAYAVSRDDADEWLYRGASFPVYSDVRLMRYALSE